MLFRQENAGSSSNFSGLSQIGIRTVRLYKIGTILGFLNILRVVMVGRQEKCLEDNRPSAGIMNADDRTLLKASARNLRKAMNPIGREQIARLYDLAQEKTEQARRVLVENISDLFLSKDGRLTEYQRTLMTDIIHKLLTEVELVVRAELAAKLADNDRIPPELVRMLANDKIEIAQPVLEKSKLLRDEDLIQIVKDRSDEHRLSIALRTKISEPVSDALVEQGSEDVIEALLKNSDARISERAMEYLVAESRRVDRFQEPLLSRHDLPSGLAHRMFWWVSALLRRRIVTDFSSLDPVALDIAIQGATKLAIAGNNRGETALDRAERLVAELSAKGNLNINFLTRALKQQKIPIFVAGLGKLADVSSQTIWRVFADKGGESFAVLCRAIDMSRNDFASIFLIMSEARGGQHVRPTSVLKDALDLFDAISTANARAALSYWQRDAAYQQALDDVRDAG